MDEFKIVELTDESTKASIEIVRQDIVEFVKKSFEECSEKYLYAKLAAPMSVSKYGMLLSDKKACKMPCYEVRLKIDDLSESEKKCFDEFYKELSTDFNGVKHANSSVSKTEVILDQDKLAIWAYLNPSICTALYEASNYSPIGLQEDQVSDLSPIVDPSSIIISKIQDFESPSSLIESPSNQNASGSSKIIKEDLKSLLKACKKPDDVTENEIKLIKSMGVSIDLQSGWNIVWNVLRKNLSRLSKYGSQPCVIIKPIEVGDYILLGYTGEGSEHDCLVVLHKNGSVELVDSKDSDDEKVKVYAKYSNFGEFISSAFTKGTDGKGIYTESPMTDCECPFELLSKTLDKYIPRLQDILEVWDTPFKNPTLISATPSRFFDMNSIYNHITSIMNGLVDLIKTDSAHQTLSSSEYVWNSLYSLTKEFSHDEYLQSPRPVASMEDHALIMTNFINHLDKCTNEVLVESRATLPENTHLMDISKEYFLAFTKIFLEKWSMNVDSVHTMFVHKGVEDELVIL